MSHQSKKPSGPCLESCPKPGRRPRISKTFVFLILLLTTATIPFTRGTGMAGIPEPGVVLFGQVRDGAGTLITEGRLAWTIRDISYPDADPVALCADLEEIEYNGVAFSYTVLLPAEQEIPELPMSENAVALSADPATFSWSATLVGTAVTRGGALELSLDDRGTAIMIEIDGCEATAEDTDGDCLDDDWELQIVQFDPDDEIESVEDVNPGDDFDQDGFDNAVEEQEGSDPTDPEDAPGSHTVQGDITGDGKVDLKDAIWAFDVMNGIPHQTMKIKADVNGDGRIDMIDIFQILETIQQ